MSQAATTAREGHNTFTSLSIEKDGSEDLDFTRVPKRNNLPFSVLLSRLTFFLALLGLILSIIALSKSSDSTTISTSDPVSVQPKETANLLKSTGIIDSEKRVSKIGFGSCTTYYLHPQTVWTNGVVPSKPDAWIWLGDFVYMDSAIIDCDEHKEAPECNCQVTAITYPPHSCMIGNITHARSKVRMQLANYGYQQFLRYMCPSFDKDFKLPPIGPLCPKPIIGTYDDHDFGWNNGNRDLPNKFEYKNLFLDAIGEPQDSPRRSGTQGIQFKYTLNGQGPEDQRIDVFLLDERYDRDPLPCDIRRDWCNKLLDTKKNESSPGHRYLWCEDLLKTGGRFGTGSCCRADDKWAYGWCKDNSDSDDPLWDVACDPSSDRFGAFPLEVDSVTNSLRMKEHYDDLSDATEESTFCDLMGPKQRRWLQQGLNESKAPLKLVVSGSVPFGNPLNVEERGRCSEDDFECYKVAQANFAHMLGKVDTGCVVLLTGDYHLSDLKALIPGSEATYSKHYPSDSFKKPIYQAMSSGLTTVTAKIPFDVKNPCQKWARDEAGMRPFGECSLVVGPSFGMVEIDWDMKHVALQHRSIEDGKITTGTDGTKQELIIDLTTCEMIN